MKPRGAAGFTLIELVVTVAIVGLLASMAMPMTQLVVKRAREQELRADLREIRDALDRYNELWRYSCLPAQGGATAANGAAAQFGGGVSGAGVQPSAAGGAGGAAGQPATSANGQAGGFSGGGGLSGGGLSGGGLSGGSIFGGGNGGSNATTGTTNGAGLGGAGGLDASTVGTIGGNGTQAAKAVPPVAPKMRCPADSNGWPKDLQTLVAGVDNIASPRPGAKVYFLRRIPRDPMLADAPADPEQGWGKRSYASPPDDPQEGDDVYDVHSLSTANDLTGGPYRDW